ncbi:MAG: KpsF/GutQ family sugar-phosphate isomerase [Rhodovibrionaceae bacterium]
MSETADSQNDTAARQPDVERDVAVGRRVLTLEAAGLNALGDSLGESFAAALDILAAIEDRVIVTGMGKSGHIANKLAATLASTGTPAQFVHPAEASHGDLGMITRKDAIVAISNSGKTTELADVLAHSARFKIPLIGITSQPDSTLAQTAAVALLLPLAAEACPMGLAPTTSTTMMLALGDALAVALLERKGFSPQDFQLLHPGGTLSRKLLRVSDIMHGAGELPLCDAETGMDQAILIMTRYSFGCVGVVDAAQRLIGVVTDGDLRRHMASDLLDRPVAEVMTKDPMTIRPDVLAAEALGLMNTESRPVTSLFVVEDGRPSGLLHIHDCLRAGVA